MNVDASLPAKHMGFGYQFLKWTLFVIELCFLYLLLIMAFLVPVIPGAPWGKIPDVALLALLSAVVSLLTGALFLKASRSSSVSLLGLLSTPPCVVGGTVITLVAVPLLIGFISSR